MLTPEQVPEALVEKVTRARYEAEREVMAGRGVQWPGYDSPVLRQAQQNWLDEDKQQVREILALAWEEIHADGYSDGFAAKEGFEAMAQQVPNPTRPTVERVLEFIPAPRVSEYVSDWPQDEQDLWRGDWLSFTERNEALDLLRRQKVARAVTALLSLEN